MSTPPDPSRPPGDSSLTYGEASRFLRLGLSNSSKTTEKPAAALLRRLRAPDGPRWLESALRTLFEKATGSPGEQLLNPETSLERLVEIKNRSKTLAGGADDEQPVLIGMIGYFLTIAAALAYHGVLICSRSRAEVDQTLRELVPVVPAPWPELLNAALRAPHGPANSNPS